MSSLDDFKREWTKVLEADKRKPYRAPRLTVIGIDEPGTILMLRPQTIITPPVRALLFKDIEPKE